MKGVSKKAKLEEMAMRCYFIDRGTADERKTSFNN